MVKSCCAYGCKKEWTPIGNIKFHNFPFRRPEILEKWINAVGRKNWTPSKWSKLCSKHFLPSDYLNRPGCIIELLKPDAVPSIFLKSSSLKYAEPVQETDTLTFNPITPLRRRNKKELDSTCIVQNLGENIKRSNRSMVTRKINEHPVEEQDIQTSDKISREKGIDSLTAMKLVTDLERNLGRDSFTKLRKSRDETSQFTPSDVQVRAIPITILPMNTSGGITNVAKYNFEEICRCCVINRGEVNLFEAYFQDKSMSDLISFCTNEKISSSDNLPRTICNVCMQLLISAFTFIDKFKRAQIHVRQIGRLLTGNCQILNNETYTDDVEPSEEIPPNEKNYVTSSCDSITSFKSNFRGLKNVYDQLCSVLSRNKSLLKETDRLLEKTLGDFDDEQPVLYEVKFEDDETPSELILQDDSKNEESHNETDKNQSMNVEVCNLPDSVVEENCESSFTTVVADKKITVIPCLECPERLLSEKAVQRHYKQTRHRMPDRFKCNICSSTFALKGRYKNHLSKHREDRSLCEICGTKITHSNLRRHLQVHSTKATNICQYCGKAFTQKATLDYHISTKHAEKCEEILCSLCGKLYGKLCELTYHLNTIHKDENIHDKLYGCEICPKYFVSQSSLRLHEKYTHSEEPVLRRRYNTTKTIQSKRNRNKKVYNQEKKQCPICQQGIHYAAFKVHMNMHQKRFKCSKRFRQFAHLRSHINLRSENKPYKCEYCEKTFRHNSTLATHVRTHNGETPYRCPICNKGFTNSSFMRKHHLIHIKTQKQNRYKFEKLNEC